MRYAHPLGVAAAAIGLILATMLRQAPIALDSLKAVGLALLVFVTYGLLHWQLLLVLLLSVPLGMGLYWQEAAKKPATSHSEQGIEAGSRG